MLRSFEGKIFSHKSIQRTRKYWMYFEDDGFLVGKKILSKPCKSLCESAQGRYRFLVLHDLFTELDDLGGELFSASCHHHHAQTARMRVV